MNFDFFKMPAWGQVLFAVWAFVSFVLWYLYRHVTRKLRAGFKTTFFIISALFFFVFSLNWLNDRPQSNPWRVAIFPFLNQADTSSSISWESLALSEIPVSFLEQINMEKILPYPPDWITSGANSDSLPLPDYCLNFARRIKLDYAVLGSFLRKPSGFFVSFQLLKVKKNEVVFEKSKQINFTEIQEFCRQLSTLLANRILNQDFKSSWKVVWDSNERMKTFFNYKLCLLSGKAGPAFNILQKSVEKDSNSSILLNALAEIYLKMGNTKKKLGQNFLQDFQSARSLLQKSLSLDEADHKTLRLLAELYLANERWNQAEEFLQNSLLRNQWDSKTYVDFTQLHRSRYTDKGFDSEDELLQRAIFVNPLDFEARLILADMLNRKNRPNLAINTVKEILRINPSRVDALMKLGNIYMTQNDLLNCLEVYQKVTELEPENGEVYYNLGIVYYHQKDYERAIEFFEHAIKSIDHVDSHLYLAYIYEQKKDIDRAITHLRTRISKRRGRNDKFAEEARKRLAQMMSGQKARTSKLTQTKSQE